MIILDISKWEYQPLAYLIFLIMHTCHNSKQKNLYGLNIRQKKKPSSKAKTRHCKLKFFSIIIISTLKRKRKKKNEEIYLEQLAVTHLTCISTRIANF